jgi:hypothetical protein
MSESGRKFQIFAIGMRIGGPAVVLGFFVGLFLHDAGKISVAAWTGIMMLAGALRQALRWDGGRRGRPARAGPAQAHPGLTRRPVASGNGGRGGTEPALEVPQQAG